MGPLGEWATGDISLIDAALLSISGCDLDVCGRVSGLTKQCTL